MNTDEPRWMSWETRPDGGNIFRPTKAHALIGDRLTARRVKVPMGGLPEDPQRERFARVLAADPADTAKAGLCRRCVHYLNLLQERTP